MTPLTASRMWDKESSRAKCSFGCRVLDEVFGGGLPLNGVTEIYGEAGTALYMLPISIALDTQHIFDAVRLSP